MNFKEKKILFDRSFPSDREQRKNIVETIVEKIRHNVKGLVISDEELFLSIDETITNAMEHGNKWDPEKTIETKIYIDPVNIYISVRDEGQGFNPQKIEKKIDNRNRLKHRGRGIYIINQFCEISWNNAGNEITLIIKQQEK